MRVHKGRPVFPQLNGRSSVYGAVFIVINAAFGAGLLAFPYSFFLAGGKDNLVGGVVIEVVSFPVCRVYTNHNSLHVFTLGNCSFLYRWSNHSLLLF